VSTTLEAEDLMWHAMVATVGLRARIATYIQHHVYLIVVVSKSWKCWFGCGYEYEKN
jgi:uncharacterized protein YhjY with autotransporter beta-barrel domain